jgi:hypothetical protein
LSLQGRAQVRHCEARSAVAIQAFMQPPMDRFVPRDDKPGVSDDSAASLRGAAFSREELATWQSRLSYNRQWIASCLAMTSQESMTAPPRHCEARSAVAIHTFP